MSQHFTVYINSNGTMAANGELGFAFLAPLIGLIPGVMPFITGLFSGAGPKSGLPYGLAGITTAGNQVIEGLNQIKAALQSGQLPQGVTPAAAVAEAQKAQQVLVTGVYQATKGKDAAALVSFKQQAAQLVGEIQSLAAAMPQTVQTPQGPMIQTIGPDGQPVLTAVAPAGTDMTIAGIPVMYLVLGGAGVLGLVLFLRK